MADDGATALDAEPPLLLEPAEEEPAIKFLLDLPADLIRTILSYCHTSLAAAECTCHALRADDDLWREVVLKQWGWLVHSVRGLHLHDPHAAQYDGPWKSLFVRLYASGRQWNEHTRHQAKFCVVGGTALEHLRIGTLEPDEDLSCAFALWLNGPGPLNPEPLSRVENWRSLPSPSKLREMASCVRLSTGVLAVIGGANYEGETIDDGSNTGWVAYRLKMRALSSVETLFPSNSPNSRGWTTMASLNTARCCSGAAADKEGRVWVVGGGESMYRGAATLRSVECYQPDEEAWVYGPELTEPRCALGVAISHERDELYACGGYAGDMLYLDTCEVLSLADGGNGSSWQALPNMSCKRAGCSANTGPDGRIYVLGGGPDGTSEWKTMEALDPRMRVWDTSLASCKVGRHYNAAAFGPDGMLYASGAFRHDGQLDVVERYDPRADRWEMLSQIGFTVKFSSGAWVF